MTPQRMAQGLVVGLLMMLAACSIQIPADPHGTLDHVRDGVMRVGATENAPWVEIPDQPDGDVEPTGTEPELVNAFAASLDAEVAWIAGSEADLLGALDRGEIDMVIGGFDSQTLWSQQAAVTVPYLEAPGPGGPAKHVMLVRMGENRFLVALENFLLEERA